MLPKTTLSSFCLAALCIAGVFPAKASAAVEPRSTPTSSALTIWRRASLASQGDDSLIAWRRAELVHARSMAFYYRARQYGGPRDVNPAQRKLALADLAVAERMLEDAGARESPDLRLRFDLGRVLSELQKCPDATLVLTDALARAPTSIYAGDAWFEIAICQSLSKQHEAEERAYLRALELEDSLYTRAVILSNLAESRMAQGKLAEAIVSAETSLSLFPENVLPRWTLAVARDRSGDESGAIADARQAILLDPDYRELSAPGVFFEPAYERNWYVGLGEIAHAEVATLSAADRRLHLVKALARFESYLAAAPEVDRYRRGALEHRAQLKARLMIR